MVRPFIYLLESGCDCLASSNVFCDEKLHGFVFTIEVGLAGYSIMKLVGKIFYISFVLAVILLTVSGFITDGEAVWGGDKEFP